MEKFGQFICKHKVAILIISLLLLIPSIIGYKATRVNYDILVYLPDNIETIKGENILADDFDMGAFSVVILENMQSKDIIELEKQFREVGNVEKVVGLTDIIGTDVPLEMLPDEVKDKLYKDNTTPVLVTFKDGIFTLSLGRSGYGRDYRRVEIKAISNVRIYSDNSILEIYLNEGAEVFTSRIYNKKLDETLTLSGTGDVTLTKWSL